MKKKEPVRNVLSFKIISLINFDRHDHFMGGVITWRPLNASISFPIARTQVLMTTRFFWCACFNSTCLCLNCNTNEAVVNNYTLNYGGFSAINSISSESIPIDGTTYCCDFNITDNWSIGSRVEVLDMATLGDYTGSYSTCCWVSSNTYAFSSGWSMMFKINLSQRNDTGRINSSPECNIRPYIKYNQACKPFKIPVSDVDGDVIKCRCSNGVCLAHVILDEEKCLLTFDPAFPGDYQMEILVEDFPNNMTNISLSTVPVSFIVSFATTSKVFIGCKKNEEGPFFKN